MTIEELIMPRYKVIADYPNNNYYDVMPNLDDNFYQYINISYSN